MERTTTKTVEPGSDSNTDSAKNISWISSRQHKKKRDQQDSDSEGPITHNPRRYKSTCCPSLEVLNETLNAFREEQKTMHNLLSVMKEEQEENYVRIKSDISEIKSEIIEIKIKNIENEKIIETVESKCSELFKKQQDFIEKTKKQENVLKDLIQKQVYLDKCNKSLEERIRLLEQKEFNLDIELANVEMKEGENVIEIVKNIAEELKVNKEDITKTWRIKGKSLDGKPKPIIVSLRTREARMSWLKSKKVVLTNHSIYKNNNDQRIYVNERITRQIRQLFWSAKLQLRNEFKFIWIQNGKILLRKNESEKKVEVVSCEGDINQLLKCNRKNAE